MIQGINFQLVDFLTIIIIIILSSVFTTSYIKKYDLQAMFILLSCLALIINKILKENLVYNNIKNNTETFNNMSDDLLNFIEEEIPNNVSKNDILDYKKKMIDLLKKVESMNENLEEIKNLNKLSSGIGDGSMENELSLDASQQIQDFRIKKMQEEIDTANDILKEAKIKEDSAKFKKIPIYSSCVVANADGSLSADTPSRSGENVVNNQNVQGISNTNNLSNFNPPVNTNLPNQPSNLVSTNNGLNLQNIVSELLSSDKTITVNLNK